MEERAGETCGVVYFCPASAGIDSELYHSAQLPTATSSPGSGNSARNDIYHNVRVLLDADQGGYERVFVTSRLDECLGQLDTFTQTQCSLLLIDVDCSSRDEQGRDNALPLLRRLVSDGATTRNERRIMPFVLAAARSSLSPEKDLGLATTYLDAGALTLVGSPLSYDDTSRIVSHVKSLTRPTAHKLGFGMARNLVQNINSNLKPQTAAHRPDLILSPERRDFVASAVVGWNFPAHDLNMDELTYGAVLMLEHVLQNAELEPYRLSRPELVTFILATRRQYKHEQEVFYHNWRHAVDVTQSLYCFLCDVRLCPPNGGRQTSKKGMSAVERLLTPADALTLLISAVGHDVGHPGVNNAFLVACNHELAHLYNDKSVLENYHCSAYSQLVRCHWPSLTQLPRFRSTMILIILATDMQRHFEYMSQLGDLKEKVSKAELELAKWNEKDKEHAKELTLALLIKAADISNIARPFDISAQWARILSNEFARQGELEAELQIPTCLFGGPPDREDLLAAAQSQKGFMNLFGFPLFRGICEVMPNVSCTLPELEKNKEIWERKIAELVARREVDHESTKSPPTYDVSEDKVQEARAKKRESEPAVVPVEIPQTPSRETRRQPALDMRSSPIRHPGSEQRLRLIMGASATDHKRSSAPLLSTGNDVPLSPGGSRRSSKDVALTQLHDYSAFAPLTMKQNNAPGSRRGSADASWSIHQSYPSSRRGSKDESLTTILVTSQTAPITRTAPNSPAKSSKPIPANNDGAPAARSASGSKHSPVAPRSSLPSSRSQTVSSGTETTGQHSPSTQPSSISTTADESTPSAATPNSNIPRPLGDPFLESGNWPNTIPEGERPAPAFESVASAPATPAHDASKSNSPRIIARLASADSEDVSGLRLGKPEGALRESRSRSRLRGLKFWKKRRDVPGLDGNSGESSP